MKTLIHDWIVAMWEEGKLSHLFTPEDEKELIELIKTPCGHDIDDLYLMNGFLACSGCDRKPEEDDE